VNPEATVGDRTTHIHVAGGRRLLLQRRPLLELQSNYEAHEVPTFSLIYLFLYFRGMQIDRRDVGAVDTDTRSTTDAPRFRTKMGRRQRGSRAGTEIDEVTFLRGPLEALGVDGFTWSVDRRRAAQCAVRGDPRGARRPAGRPRRRRDPRGARPGRRRARPSRR